MPCWETAKRPSATDATTSQPSRWTSPCLWKKFESCWMGIRSPMKTEQAPTASGRVLIVDDNEANRDILGRRLSCHGYQTTLVSSGQEALVRIAGQPFDLVLL